MKKQQSPQAVLLVVDSDKRKEWLRALKQFKAGMKIRAKLGVIESLCKEVRDDRHNKNIWAMPEWTNDKWVTLLYTCIRDNAFPAELVKGFVQTAEVTFMSAHMQPRVELVLSTVDEICNMLSVPLRIKFGVLREQDGEIEETAQTIRAATNPVEYGWVCARRKYVLARASNAATANNPNP